METIKLTNIDTDLYINRLNTVPVGSIMCFAGATAPEGWLLCDGQAINRINYKKLFSTIGTTYGNGNGSTTFNLPNLCDRFPMGKGTNSLGSVGGSNSVTLTSSQLPSHSHTATVSDNGSHSHNGTTNITGNHTHTYVDAYFAENYGGASVYGTGSGTDYDNNYYYRPNPVTNSAGDHSHTLTIDTVDNHTHTVTINSTGVTEPSIDITNKYITLNYIIRY